MNTPSTPKFLGWLILVAVVWVVISFILAHFLDDHSGVLSSWWSPLLFGIPALPVAFFVAYILQDILAILERRRRTREYVRLRESLELTHGAPNATETERPPGA